jgi:hypothetical protein
MANGDIYELTHNSIFGGQDVDNVYYYLQDDNFPVGVSEAQIAAGVATRFYATVATALKACLTGDVAFQSIYVRNLFDPTSFHTEYVTDVGTHQIASGDTLPPHDAVNITFSTANQQIGPGSKRLSGIAEGAQTDGIITSVSLLAAYAAYAASATGVMGVLLSGVTVNFLPIIVKRINISDAGVIKYRLPQDANEAQFAQLDLFAVNPVISTQRSRRFSRT